MKRKSAVKYRILNLIEFLFLMIVISSVVLASGLYAKYASSGTATATLKVAKFDLRDSYAEEWKDSIDIRTAPNSEDYYNFSIDMSDCEVSASVTVTVTMEYRSLPLLLTVYSGHNAVGETKVFLADSSSSGYSVSATFTVHPGDMKNLCLKASWISSELDETYSGMTDSLEVSFRCEQIPET